MISSNTATATSPTDNSPLLCTVEAMASRMEGIGVGHLRWQIFNHGEKLENVGAIVRVGHRIFFNPEKYLNFLETGGLNG